MSSRYKNFLNPEELIIVNNDNSTQKEKKNIYRKGSRRARYLLLKYSSFTIKDIKYFNFDDYLDFKKGIDFKKIQKRISQRKYQDKNRDEIKEYMKKYNKEKYHEKGSWREKRDTAVAKYECKTNSKFKIYTRQNRIERVKKQINEQISLLNILQNEINFLKGVN